METAATRQGPTYARAVIPTRPGVVKLTWGELALEPCSACGGELAPRRVVFARCLGCGAENYRPRPDDPPAEVRVARFWRRSGAILLEAGSAPTSRSRPVGANRRAFADELG